MRTLLVSVAMLLLASCHPHHDGQGPTAHAAHPEEHYGSTIEDDEAWKLAHPSRCAKPVRPSDCNGVREYLVDFPKGKHAGEAKTMIDGLPARLENVPEETRWEKADAAQCKVADDPGACDDVDAYVAKFPMGKHAAEARALLAEAKPKLEGRKKVLDEAGVEIEVLGTDHTGKDCPPILGDGEHHALCLVLDVRVRRPLTTAAMFVKTDCGNTKGAPKTLYWATSVDLTKVPSGQTVDVHIAVPRAPQCTVEVGLGNVPNAEKDALRRFCLFAATDPEDDHAEAGSCPAG